MMCNIILNLVDKFMKVKLHFDYFTISIEWTVL